MQHLYCPHVTFKTPNSSSHLWNPLWQPALPPPHLQQRRKHTLSKTHTHTCTYIPKQLRHYKTLLNFTLEVKCHMCQYKTDVLQLPPGSNFICDTTLLPASLPPVFKPPPSPATSPRSPPPPIMHWQHPHLWSLITKSENLTPHTNQQAKQCVFVVKLYQSVKSCS